MKHIVLIGAGGTGISSLAHIFRQLGYTNILCIDHSPSQITQQLEDLGFEVIIGHNIYQPQAGDMVIYSDAALGSHEVVVSHNSDLISCYSYHEFLGQLSRYFTTISIAGTHGKSTTTSITITSLIQLTDQVGLGFVGALVPQLNGQNFYLNPQLHQPIASIFDAIIHQQSTIHGREKKYYLILEADEFNKHFLYYETDYTIILNMKLDHSDVYHNYQEYIDTFQQLCNKTTTHIIMGANTTESDLLHHPLLHTYQTHHIDLKYLFGEHNQHNSSIVFHLISLILPHIPAQIIEETIGSFQGLRRRMEFLGNNTQGAMIYSDYGHHPDELGAVYEAFRAKYPTQQLCAVFQPHQLRRVMEFWSEFIHILQQFDEVLIYNIYVAREDFDTIKSLFHQAAFDDISTLQELGTLFAQLSNGQYITHYDYIQSYLTSLPSEYIGICFSAGDLDYRIRNSVNIIHPTTVL